jgi:hypothetical protein
VAERRGVHAALPGPVSRADDVTGTATVTDRPSEPLDDAPRRPHATKDRRRWCRGRDGTEHVVEVRLSRDALYLLQRHETVIPGQPTPTQRRDGRPGSCYRTEWWPWQWLCRHQQVCVNCGKILVRSLGNDCPDFTTEVTWRKTP